MAYQGEHTMTNLSSLPGREMYYNISIIPVISVKYQSIHLTDHEMETDLIGPGALCEGDPLTPLRVIEEWL
jgi:hypothetical protein